MSGPVPRDRFGLGWRPELAVGVLSNLESIDLLEVIADDYFGVSRRRLDSLRLLRAQVPVVLHAVGMGLASTAAVDSRRLDRLARVAEAVDLDYWSEHLAFVRGGGVEIGHLAAPPRNRRTIEGTARNLATARRVVGSPPRMENIATLIDPPGSECDEPAWLTGTLEACQCDLLLDLHNVYANASNFGSDPQDFIRRLPAGRITTIHIAGGRWIPPESGWNCRPRLLDDHQHDVPPPVYQLLEQVAAVVPRPFDVILERDGQYPPMGELLAQLSAARAAVAAGRLRNPAFAFDRAAREVA